MAGQSTYPPNVPPSEQGLNEALLTENGNQWLMSPFLRPYFCGGTSGGVDWPVTMFLKYTFWSLTSLPLKNAAENGGKKTTTDRLTVQPPKQPTLQLDPKKIAL